MVKLVNDNFEKHNYIIFKLATQLLCILVLLVLMVFVFLSIYMSNLQIQKNKISNLNDNIISKELELLRVNGYLNTVHDAKKFLNRIQKNISQGGTGINFQALKSLTSEILVKSNILPNSTVAATPSYVISSVNNSKQQVEGSNIIFSLYALSDSQIYNFLNYIEDNFPGFLKIKTFSIGIKENDLNSLMFTSSGQVENIIINAKIEAELYEFKTNQ